MLVGAGATTPSTPRGRAPRRRSRDANQSGKSSRREARHQQCAVEPGMRDVLSKKTNLTPKERAELEGRVRRHTLAGAARRLAMSRTAVSSLLLDGARAGTLALYRERAQHWTDAGV